MNNLKDITINTLKSVHFNFKIIFGGKFIYFLIAAFAVFLLFGSLMAFQDDYLASRDMYGILLFPALLLVFYPSVFSIQSDADQRTLEILFGIPDYRFKVWLIRLILIEFLVAILMIPFSLIAYYTLVDFPIFKMIFHVMVVVFFLSTLSFGVSTLVKNGNATAVIVIIIAIVFFIIHDSIDNSKWNLFLNPFRSPSGINEIVWSNTIKQNRLILLGIGVVFLLLGLLNLQKREKFLR